MSAQTEFDLGSLIWVKGEIDQALEKSRQSLNKYATGGDAAELKYTQTHLHQVRGAVEMVGLAGAARFAEELEVTVGAVERGEAPASTLPLVAEATTSLAQYLESLVNGAPDLALKLLPTYRRVRQARGEAQTSGADLFFPSLSGTLPAGLSPLPLDAATLAQLLKNARSRFEAGLLKWLKGERQEGCQWMMQALLGVARSQSGSLQRGFWWSAAAMVEGCIDNRATLDLDLKALFARLNQQLKRLADGGGKVAERLFRDVLYVVAKLDTQSPHCAGVRRAFQLADLMPQGALEDDAQQLAAMQTARELRELINQAKDNWGRVGGGSADKLPAVQKQLVDLASRGAKLSIGGFNPLSSELSRAVGELTSPPDEKQALEIATAMLLLENALLVFPEQSTEFPAQAAAMQARLLGSTAVPEVTLLDEVSRRAQERLLMTQVALEIQTNLGQIEQILDDFFRDPATRAELAATDAQIKQIRGALAMLDERDALTLLDACAALIKRNLAEDYTPPADELEFLAEAFSSLGFYIDGIKREDADRARIIAPWLQRIRGEAPVDDAPTQAELIAAALEAEPEGAAHLDVTAPAPAEVAPAPAVAEAPNGPAPVSDAAIDAELLEVYLEEAIEVLATIDGQLLEVRDHPSNRDALTVIRRGFHTLKGSGRMVGLNQLGEVAWAVEQVLNKWLQEERRATPAVMQLIEHTSQGFAGWVEQLKQTGTALVEASALFELAEQLKSGIEPEAHAAVEAVAEAVAPQPTEPAHELAITADASTSELTLADEIAPAAAELPPLAVVEETEHPLVLDTPHDADALALELPEHDFAPADTPAEDFTLDLEAPSAPKIDQDALSPRLEIASFTADVPTALVDAPATELEPSDILIGDVVISRVLFGIFLDEAYKHFATLSDAYHDFGAHGEVCPAFVHAAHTLCGIANTTGFTALGELGHALEQALVAHQKLGHEPSHDEKETLSVAIDRVGAMLGEISHYQPPTEDLQILALLVAQTNRLKDEAGEQSTQHDTSPSAETLAHTLELDELDEFTPPPVSAIVSHPELSLDELDLDLAALEAHAPAESPAAEAGAAPVLSLDFPVDEALETNSPAAVDLALDDLTLTLPEDAHALTLDVEPATDEQLTLTPATDTALDEIALAGAEESHDLDLDLDLMLEGEEDSSADASPPIEIAVPAIVAASAPLEALTLDDTPSETLSDELDLELDLSEAAEQPVQVEAPADEALLTLDEAPAAEEIVTLDAAPAIEASLTLEDATVLEASPTQDETPAAEETLTLDEAPAVEETLTLDEAPAVEETLTPNEAPTVEETLTLDEVPAVEETLTLDEAPTVEETLTLDETPAAEETPTQDAAPADEEIITLDAAPAIEETLSLDETLTLEAESEAEAAVAESVAEDLATEPEQESLPQYLHTIAAVDEALPLVELEPAVTDEDLLLADIAEHQPASPPVALDDTPIHIDAALLAPHEVLAEGDISLGDIELAPVDEAIVVESPADAAADTKATDFAPTAAAIELATLLGGLAQPAPTDKDGIGSVVSLPVDRLAEITVQDELDDQLLPIFLEEAQELIPQIAADLRNMRGEAALQPLLDSLKRALHTLKGSARMAGAMRLGEATHNLESRLINAGESVLPALLDELDADFDAIVELHDRLLHGEPVAENEEAAASEVAPTEQAVTATAAKPSALAQPLGLVDPEMGKTTVRVRADLVDRLVNQAGEVAIARTRIESEMLALKRSLFDLTDNVGRLRNQLREIEIQAESQMQSRLSHVQDVPDFDPLEFDRFSRLQELTRFMAESVNDVATVQHNLLKNLDESTSALQQQSRLTRDLQQELMRVRMVPFSSLSERLYRLVRQTGKETGKKVNLELRGARVEIDRSVLEKMASPFEHMLRNAIDHGLETPDIRQAHGKPEFGEILVEARQEGNELVLTLRDDGAGLNLTRIREKGLEKGLLEAGMDYSDAQIMHLIFAAGFSTASQVTQLSGRGIGMDVVKAEIEDLGGRVDVDSTPGKGTVFTIHLPLTLAVTQTVLVKVGDKTYAIPSVMVEQVQELKQGPLEKLYQARQAEWMGNIYPFHYLPRLLGDYERTPEQKRYNTVILLRSGIQRIALHVDLLMRNQEVVVKNIGPQLVRVAGVAGATVLGNGEIVLILNPLALSQRRMDAPVADFDATVAASKPTAEEMLQTAPVVMVVDDSLTVRKITGRLLAREGYQVVTAKDGVDALQQLQDIRPAVMLLDVEMPRMDGFELTRNLRLNTDTRDIPIIMITSRTADKHKNYAFELGVNVFLGKPYQEDELLEHIRRLIGEEMPIA